MGVLCFGNFKFEACRGFLVEWIGALLAWMEAG
jgi:hypothetical protein